MCFCEKKWMLCDGFWLDRFFVLWWMEFFRKFCVGIWFFVSIWKCWLWLWFFLVFWICLLLRCFIFWVVWWKKCFLLVIICLLIDIFLDCDLLVLNVVCCWDGKCDVGILLFFVFLSFWSLILLNVVLVFLEMRFGLLIKSFMLMVSRLMMSCICRWLIYVEIGDLLVLVLSRYLWIIFFVWVIIEMNFMICVFLVWYWWFMLKVVLWWFIGFLVVVCWMVSGVVGELSYVRLVILYLVLWLRYVGVVFLRLFVECLIVCIFSEIFCVVVVMVIVVFFV